jgi:ATP-dependent DNA helicase RecQ
MFSGFVQINEEDLSRKSAASRDKIYQYLVKLSSFNIIRYIPGKKTALVIFKEERLERKAILISPENYLHVKERYEERLKKIIDYVDSDSRCRSVVLLEYFGEESEPCGKCDVCREKKKSGIVAEEFESIKNEIKTRLIENNFDAEELVRNMDQPEEKVIEIIRLLLDQNFIIKAGDNKLSWNSLK